VSEKLINYDSIAGATATIFSDAILTPMDAVKQKRQLNLKAYHGTAHCLKIVIREEGIRALYAGYTTTIIMNVPFHAIYFNIYEFLRKKLQNKGGTYSPSVHFFAGGGAGMVAAAVTNPLDVTKTRLQTQGDMLSTGHGRHYHGLVRTLKIIWHEEGIRGLTRGIVPRMIFHSFSASILWTTYEYFKYVLGAERESKMR